MRELIRHIIREHTSKVNESGPKPMTTQEFIRRAKEVHGDKYNYDETKYINARTKVKIKCPKHGYFEQLPSHHITIGNLCPKCASENQTLGTDEFIKKAKEIHGNKYDYSKTEYEGYRTPVTIICPIHGEFTQLPGNHLKGSGCIKCGQSSQKEKRTKPLEEFLKTANEIHKGKYDYSKVIFKGARTPIQIICPIHGEFTQYPGPHLRGQGCPICQESKGELLIKDILENNNISFIPQYKFTDCTNKLQGRSCRKLPFDFYLPEINTCLEFDGAQHHIPVDWFGGEKTLQKIKYRDKLKDEYCKKNNIQLIRIPYTMSPEEIEIYLLMELGFSKQF